jgi:acetolactate synthase-1/3 small subunit
VIDHHPFTSVQRELILVKVSAPPAKRPEIYNLVEIFGGKIVDISKKTITVEATGEPETLNNFIELLRPYAIKELNRTGRISLLKEQ